MADLFSWPDFAPKTVSFVMRGRTISGPVSLSGLIQTGQSDAGYWMATLSRVPVGKGSDRAGAVKLFRAFTALLEGGAHHARVPVFDTAQTPWPIEDGAAVTGIDPVAHDDGVYFDDGTGYAQAVIDVEIAAAAAARATAIDVTVNYAGDIVGGEYFSIGERLHIIRAVLAVDGDDQTWAIWPPLREAVTAGEGLNFDRPTCRMKLVSEDGADLALEMGRYGFPDMTFVEAVS